MHRDVPFCSVITVHAENFLFLIFFYLTRTYKYLRLEGEWQMRPRDKVYRQARRACLLAEEGGRETEAAGGGGPSEAHTPSHARHEV